MDALSNSGFHQSITRLIREAEAQICGFSSATAEAVLKMLYGISPDEVTRTAGPQIRIPTEQGDALNAYVGVCQFIFFCGRMRGLPQDELDRLCSGWQDRFADYLHREGDCGFDEVIFLAVDYLRFDGADIGLDFTGAKPNQYYEKIYTDREAMFSHSPYALEEKLTKAVIKGSWDAAFEALREIRKHGDKAVVANDPVRSAKNSMIGSIAFLSRAAIQAGVNADSAFALSDSLIQQVESMNSKSAILDFEESILLKFIGLVNRRLEATYSATVTRVIHYIENRLNARILLGEAAAYANVHPAYLSARFKKETGFTFSAFVMMRKIQESTYFVRHTKYSVSQIALIYGFSSHSHFITAFKRVMGITPTEFRRRYLAE